MFAEIPCKTPDKKHRYGVSGTWLQCAACNDSMPLLISGRFPTLAQARGRWAAEHNAIEEVRGEDE